MGPQTSLRNCWRNGGAAPPKKTRLSLGWSAHKLPSLHALPAHWPTENGWRSKISSYASFWFRNSEFFFLRAKKNLFRNCEFHAVWVPKWNQMEDLHLILTAKMEILTPSNWLHASHIVANSRKIRESTSNLKCRIFHIYLNDSFCSQNRIKRQERKRKMKVNYDFLQLFVSVSLFILIIRHYWNPYKLPLHPFSPLLSKTINVDKTQRVNSIGNFNGF